MSTQKSEAELRANNPDFDKEFLAFEVSITAICKCGLTREKYGLPHMKPKSENCLQIPCNSVCPFTSKKFMGIKETYIKSQESGLSEKGRIYRDFYLFL